MKRTLFVTAALAAVFFFSTNTVRAQQDEPVAGGYAPASRSSKEIRKAAGRAVAIRAKQSGTAITLVKIEKAEVQVVAGMNYRLCMRVREGGRGTKTVTAVLFRSLRGGYSLSRWRAGGCREL